MSSPRAAIAAVLALASLAFSARADFPEPRVIALNPRVHVLLGPTEHANPANQGYMINATAIVGDRGVILVDSGASRDVGLHIARAVRRVTDKPIAYVVNTHSHGDHYLGNAAFPGATVVSSEACRKLVLDSGGEWLELMTHDIGHALEGTKPIAASKTYGAGRTAVTIEGVRIVFWVPRGSHTAGDMMVYLPDDRVLIAGDILVEGVVPTLQDGNLRNWIATLDEIAATDATRFVPGHGNLMDRDAVLALRSDLAAFRAGIRDAYNRHITEADARGSLALGKWERLGRAYVIPRNINQAYIEAEADSFEDRP